MKSLVCRGLIFALLAVTLVACQKPFEREASRSQALLDEADLLMEVRRFDQAEDKARDALDRLNIILAKVPDNADYRLIRARANITLFMSQNTIIIENAKPRPRSLVRIPDVTEYIDYDSTMVPAEKELKEVLNNNSNLALEQKGYAHGMLAVIFRLNPATARQADEQYAAAIGAYEGWLKEMRRDRPRIGSNEFNIMRLENQIRGLLMARAEVNLLAENWAQALSLLEQVMAGNDLQYFEVQFPFFEKNIASIEQGLDTDTRISVDPRVERLNTAIAKTRKGQFLQREKVAAQDPRKAQMLQMKVELAETKNNLTYRIICYYNLNDQARLNAAREVLRANYPELDAELASQLKI